MSPQPGILSPLPPVARSLIFNIKAGATQPDLQRGLSQLTPSSRLVVGLGQELIARLDGHVTQLKPPKVFAGPEICTPATPAALWCWLRADDRGELLHQAQRLVKSLSGSFDLSLTTDTFTHRGNRDLSGYEDGTENPTGAAAKAAALVSGQAQHFNGSSFVAVQRWTHNLSYFSGLSQTEKDHTIGRRLSDNEELADAPSSAHVKRTAQETFTPEAFLLRRSMPWAEGDQGGLLFVAFGRSLDAFEAQLGRMVGLEDGITDALFRFSRPTTLSYFWCPPVDTEQLDLRGMRP